jgi:signal transduction histidine kinase
VTQRSALNIDAPVTLDELLDKNARETLAEGAADLGVTLSVADRLRVIVGPPLPPEAAAVEPEFEPVEVMVGERRYVVTALHHEGDVIGRVVVCTSAQATPPAAALRLSRHLVRLIDAFILDGVKRALSARMHMATVEEANRELTEKNRRLNQMVEQLREADRVKSNFLATVSHELRTPLTSVIGYSEMLLEGIAGELNDEQREYVRTVMEKGDQLLQLITGILDISRMEAGEQVLINLLGNAVKFTAEGGHVALMAKPGPLRRGGDRADAVHLTVRDTGIGVPKEHHAEVFDPFFQVDNSSTREYGGTGLGLSIVKRYVEAHGGQVWIDSDVGKGAAFTITLPVAPPQPT